MLILTGISIFLSAALLFLVQPMIGKVLLPSLGGSPAVWNTCMVFFQAVLLAGYGYAHILTTRAKPAIQIVIHAAVLAAAAWSLPTPIRVGEPGDANPVRWVLYTLAWTVGLAFFAVSTSGPLLQKWFSQSGHKAGKDPYFLYAASNAGSVLGLILYPFVIEPSLTREQQAQLWAGGFWALAPLVVACAAMALRRSRRTLAAPEEAIQSSPPMSSQPITWRRRGLWVMLAAIPSSLMIGATQYISTDIAPVPLLWMLPLILYLGSFILAFSNKLPIKSSVWGWAVAVLAMVCVGIMLARFRHPAGVIIGVHLCLLGASAMMCHRRLFEDRPDTGRLTEFYLWLSVGGVVGGVFNAIIAPVSFNSLAEYPIAIAAACLLRPGALKGASNSRAIAITVAAALALASAVWFCWEIRSASVSLTLLAARAITVGIPVLLCGLLLIGPRAPGMRFAAGVLVLGIFTLFEFRSSRETLLQARTFFGVIRVQEFVQTDSESGVRVPTARHLYHGETLHGVQLLPSKKMPTLAIERIATTYYHPDGPIGAIVKTLEQRKGLNSMGVLGLGTGSMAAYGNPGMKMTFFEIDPKIVEIAADKRLFTYLTNGAANMKIIGGDGRLALAAPPIAPEFDLLIVDAFSSDAIPVHLLTHEAIALYMQKLNPKGLVAIHISNRHFRLAPLLAAHAKAQNLAIRSCIFEASEEAQSRTAIQSSHWVVFARDAEDFGPLILNDPAWQIPSFPKGFRAWTDDYSNILSVVRY